jgi:hypothetical protein
VNVQNMSSIIKDRKLMFAAPIFDRQKAAGGARGRLTGTRLFVFLRTSSTRVMQDNKRFFPAPS